MTKLTKYMSGNPISFAEGVLLLSLTAAGLFHEWLSCAVSIVLCGYLIAMVKKQGHMVWRVNLAGATVGMLALFYGISAFWAVDSGMAVWGFFKFLPVLLFSLVLMQKTVGEPAESLLSRIPLLAVIMTVVSALLMLIPAAQPYVAVAGRLAGFLQYPNTFALFLLAALIIVATKTAFSRWDLLFVPILIGGILYSGSRTVMVLMVLTAVCIVIFHPNKRVKFILGGVMLLLIALAAVYAVVTDQRDAIGRFLTTSLSESTFLGRLLYFYDALPVIARHPFGLGYMGYYYLEQSIQTGVYAVRFIHNDFLQLMLDVGWIPALLLLLSIARAFFRKGTSLCKRLLLFVITAHSLFDFDLQFVALFLLLVVLLDVHSGRRVELKLGQSVWYAVCAATAAASVYIGTAQFVSHLGQYEAAQAMYPSNTIANTALLSTEKEPEQIEALADRIIDQNAHVPVAYSAKARIAYSKGDFKNVIYYKNKVLEEAPFAYAEYEEYAYMLMTGIDLYQQANDVYSVQVCQQELVSMAKRLDGVRDRLSPLGKKIDDQPQTELPADIQQYIERLG